MSDARRLAALDFPVDADAPPASIPRITITIELEGSPRVTAEAGSDADLAAFANWLRANPRIRAFVEIGYGLEDLARLRPEGENP